MSLLFKTLKYAINKINRKSVDFYKREFLEVFIAVAYFQIPKFR